MKKVLFTATVDSHIKQFHTPYLKWFKEQGYEVHVATNGKEEIPYCDVKHVVSFERSPFKINNLKAIKQLKKIIDKEHFDIIHTHTPMGSVVTRLAAKSARKKGTRVIYTAHGFHFYKGAPIINWLLFYPVEKYLAKYTDTLITINQEDYELAKRKFKKRCGDIQYVLGVGIDENRFNITMTEKKREEYRKSLGLKKDDFVMIYVARLDKNKNQGFLIEIVKLLKTRYSNIHLLLVGPDEINRKYNQQAKDVIDRVHFLGLRKDIPELLSISDISLSSSRREGLPVNVLEAISLGKPIIATNTRGAKDIIKDGKNGYIVRTFNTKEFSNKILKLYNNKELCQEISRNNKEDIKKYYLSNIMNDMKKIYTGVVLNKQSDTIDLTFGIPMYNSERYIGQLLNCFKATNAFNYEILIVNDGSTDNSVSICNKRKDLNIRIINQINSGVSSARNKLINEAKGRWLTFIDSDDLIDFEKYEDAYKKIKKYNAEFLISSKEYSLPKLIEKEIINSPCQKFYCTKFLRENNILFDSNINLGEDLLFNLQYYKTCSQIVFFNNQMYQYRKINDESLTSKYRENKFEELMTVNEKCKKMFTDKRITNSFEYIRIKNCFSCLKSEILNNENTQEEIKRYIKRIKLYKRFEFKILNSFKTTCVYYIWYILPSSLMNYITKMIIGSK